MNRPQAEYSADATVENEEGTTKQKIFVTATKERKEMLTGSGEGAFQIFRYDNKVMWMLMTGPCGFFGSKRTGIRSTMSLVNGTAAI